MDMLNTIKTVLEVARLGSFSQAADKLGLSSSSVSRQINGFEQWLGIPIFQRTTRRVTLTNAGEFFIDRLQNIALDIKSLREDADALVETPRGRLRITSTHFYARTNIMPYLKGFIEKYPKVQIQFELSDTLSFFDSNHFISHLGDYFCFKTSKVISSNTFCLPINCRTSSITAC